MVTDNVRTVLFCPMGCGQTIDVTSNGFVLCVQPQCPDTHAIAKIFAEDSLKHHVRISPDGHWGAVHPLHERINGNLLDCEVHKGVADALRYGFDNGTFWMWYDETDEEWKWKTDG